MRSLTLLTTALALCVPVVAHAALVSFSGTFPEFIPTTQFSRAGADFTVRFDTPLLIRRVVRGIPSVNASITFDGIERTSRAIFLPDVIPSGPLAGQSAVTLSFGVSNNLFDARGTSFGVVGPEFIRQIAPQGYRLRQGTFDLWSGRVSVFTGVKSFSNPILNLSDISIGAGSLTTAAAFQPFASADAFAGSERLFANQITVSEMGSAAVLAGGFALLGLVFALRRRALATA